MKWRIWAILSEWEGLGKHESSARRSYSRVLPENGLIDVDSTRRRTNRSTGLAPGTTYSGPCLTRREACSTAI